MSRQRPPQVPYVYRLIRDASGQSETFGVLLLLAITVVGTTAIVTLGSDALNDTEQASKLQRTEHTMTLLDSRAAMVGLGESEIQTIDFAGSGDGSFNIDEDAGWIRVKHRNFSEDEAGDEIIYNKTMGAYIYQNGDTTIAYQGGGVWRLEEGGAAQMVSQPEFHYRDATLTLPILRVKGSGQAAGRVTTTVRAGDEPRRVFPNVSLDSPGGPNPLQNETGAPYNNSSTANPPGVRKDAKQYRNPIDQGNVTITVHSEYYEAWADYFRTRTTSKVNVHDSNKTVHIRLQSLGDPGFFGSLENDIKLRGMPTETHSMTNFTVNLTEGKNGGGAFGSMHWSFYASSDNQKFELHVSTDGAKCADVEDGSDPILVTAYYENGSGGSGHSQEWSSRVDKSDDFIEDVTCGVDDESITVNWTADSTQLEYQEISGSDISCGNSKWHYADDYAACDGEGPGTAPMDQHDVDDWSGHDCCPFRDGDSANVSFVVNHYMALMGPNFDLEGDEGPGSSNRILEDESSGTLSFDQSGGRFLTYLHITENEIEVEND